MSSSPSLSSLSSPSPGGLLPPLGPPGSAQFSSSSSSLIISSQFSGLLARMSPGLYCQQLGGSMCAVKSSLPYQEKRLLVHLTIPELVVCGLEQSSWSPKVWGLSYLPMFIWLRVLSHIRPVNKPKAAQHTSKAELLLLCEGHINLNCEK